MLLLAGVGPLAGAPRALSAWLVLAGLALTWLGVDAGRRERRAAAALAARDRAESARRAAFEEAPIGMAIATIDGRFLRVNRALCAFTGREREELEGTPIVRLMHPDDREEETQALVRLARGEGAVRGERRWLHAAGDVMWGAINATLVRDGSGVPQHVLLQVQDVTARRRYESELHYLADRDPLTGFLNRRAFARELEAHLEHVRRYRPAGAALLLDLDHFKNINDTLGHGIGDELIVALADALRGRLGERVAIARLGGDELAILVPDGEPTRSIPPRWSSRSPRRRRSPTSRARSSSRTGSTRSAAASRSTTFGAAFASFYYLKHLPFDYLKIDGGFVRGCVMDRTDQLVIKAVVDIARGLGKRTVSEMVGDEETLDLVRDLGVDYVQGFHIDRPAPLARWRVERKPVDRHGRPARVLNTLRA